MSFIVYSLIIRTAWQSKIFEFMSQEMRKPEVKTIDEAIEKDFDFYMFYCTKTKQNMPIRGPLPDLGIIL
jgi:hypothetical protein